MTPGEINRRVHINGIPLREVISYVGNKNAMKNGMGKKIESGVKRRRINEKVDNDKRK